LSEYSLLLKWKWGRFSRKCLCLHLSSDPSSR